MHSQNMILQQSVKNINFYKCYNRENTAYYHNFHQLSTSCVFSMLTVVRENPISNRRTSPSINLKFYNLFS